MATKIPLGGGGGAEEVRQKGYSQELFDLLGEFQRVLPLKGAPEAEILQEDFAKTAAFIVKNVPEDMDSARRVIEALDTVAENLSLLRESAVGAIAALYNKLPETGYDANPAAMRSLMKFVKDEVLGVRIAAATGLEKLAVSVTNEGTTKSKLMNAFISAVAAEQDPGVYETLRRAITLISTTELGRVSKGLQALKA